MRRVRLENFAKKTYLGRGRGRAVGAVERDRRVEALFGLISLLAKDVVDEHTVARHRFNVLEEDLSQMLLRIRDFFSENRQLVVTERFVSAFRVA